MSEQCEQIESFKSLPGVIVVRRHLDEIAKKRAEIEDIERRRAVLLEKFAELKNSRPAWCLAAQHA